YTPDPALPALLEALADDGAAPPEASAPDAEPEAPASAPAADGCVEAAPYDPEIAAIFAEEAAEILDGSERALQTIRETRDPRAVGELQRFLHTLKGGARMAGVLTMGDLSHALESLLAGVAAGRVAVTTD